MLEARGKTASAAHDERMLTVQRLEYTLSVRRAGGRGALPIVAQCDHRILIRSARLVSVTVWTAASLMEHLDGFVDKVRHSARAPNTHNSMQ